MYLNGRRLLCQKPALNVILSKGLLAICMSSREKCLIRYLRVSVPPLAGLHNAETKFMSSYILLRERRKEGKRERNIDWLPFACTQSGTACNPGI
ncbi:cortexin domain containing 2 isoform 1-T1 [Glossophaga mutica]